VRNYFNGRGRFAKIHSEYKDRIIFCGRLATFGYDDISRTFPITLSRMTQCRVTLRERILSTKALNSLKEKYCYSECHTAIIVLFC
jgi:hypothetical protein